MYRLPVEARTVFAVPFQSWLASSVLVKFRKVGDAKVHKKVDCLEQAERLYKDGKRHVPPPSILRLYG